MAGTSYEVDFKTRGGTEAERMASALDSLAAGLTAAGAASTQAAQGVAAASAAYKQAETSASKAAAALEQLGAKSEAMRAKMAAAMAAGDEKGFWRAAGAADRLADAEANAAIEVAAANMVLDQQAAALDAATASAAAAAEAEGALKNQIAAAKEAASDAEADALAASQLQIAESAHAAAQAEFKLAESLAAAESAAAATKKQEENQLKANAAMKAAGNEAREMRGHMMAGVKTAFGIVGAIAAVTIGFLAGAYAIASWAVELADANRTAKMGAKDELSLSNQAAKLKKNLAATFGGLKIDKLLGGLSTMVNLLDANTASGRFLKFVFEGIFQPFIDAAANAIPKVERLLLGIAIGALKFYISIKPAIAALKEMGVIDTGSWPDVLAVGKVAGQALAAALGAVVIVIGAIVGAFVLMNSAISAAVGMVFSIGAAIKGALSDAYAYLSGLSFADIGTNLITSLASAITGSAGAVISAITGVASSAIAAAKSVLGIASPSKVFAAMGDNVAGSFASSVDAGAADAEDAMVNLAAPPSASRMVQAGGGAGASRGGGRSSITIEQINVYGDDSKGTVREQIFEALDDYFGGASLSLGGGEEATA